MNNEKRRPTLDELRALPVELWQLEMAQIAADAHVADQLGIEMLADTLIFDPDLTPERIVELREKLQRATGSTMSDAVELDAA